MTRLFFPREENFFRNYICLIRKYKLTHKKAQINILEIIPEQKSYLIFAMPPASRLIITAESMIAGGEEISPNELDLFLTFSENKTVPSFFKA